MACCLLASGNWPPDRCGSTNGSQCAYQLTHRNGAAGTPAEGTGCVSRARTNPCKPSVRNVPNFLIRIQFPHGQDVAHTNTNNYSLCISLVTKPYRITEPRWKYAPSKESFYPRRVMLQNSRGRPRCVWGVTIGMRSPRWKHNVSKLLTNPGNLNNLTGKINRRLLKKSPL